MTSKKSTFSVGLKAVAYVLAFLLALYAVPTNVYAEIIDAVDSALDGTSDNVEELGSVESEKPADKAVFEVIGRREETVKHFRDADGSYVAAQYNYPVHELDANGEWQDIDNTLAESGGEYATPNARVKFAKKITGNETLFTLHDGNRKITMSLSGANKKVAGQVTNTHTEFDAEATELQKLMALDKLSSRILYPEILDDVDLEYVVQPDSIKENIIVKEKGDEYRYSFDIRLNNLTATLQEDGSVCIADPDTNEVVYVIPAGYMFDGAGEYSDAVQYELAYNGSGKFTLTVTADAEWINADERVLPVTIDPTISHKADTARDVRIYYKSSDYLWKATESEITVGGYNRLYWQSDLPVLPQGIYIVNASLSYYSDYCSTDYFSAHLVTEPVTNLTSSSSKKYPNANTIPDNPESGGFFRCLDYHHYSELITSGCCYTWNITEAVNSWYNGAENYGICIYNGTNLDPGKFRSYESSILALRPQFVITYRNIRGVESYWSYTSQNAGLAGAGAVNNATGELTLSVDTIPMTDHLFGYTPALVYNSSQSMSYNINSYNENSPYLNPSTAQGWRLNTDMSITWQTVEMADGLEYTIYTYTDGDGTEHNFTLAPSQTSAYDEDGLGLCMLLHSDGSKITLFDSSQNMQIFTVYSSTAYIGNGALISAWEDAKGNRVTFNRNPYGRITNMGLTPVGLAEITFLTFSYNTGGFISNIQDLTYGRSVSFEYSEEPDGDILGSAGAYLRTVKYAHTDGSTTSIDATVDYIYSSIGIDSEGYDIFCLTEAKDNMSGLSIHYSYNDIGKVTEITEFAIGNTGNFIEGQSLQLTYDVGYTEVKTSGGDDVLSTNDDIVTRYGFDSAARVISAYSTDLTTETVYGASGGTYVNSENDVSQNNKLKSSVISGSVSPNLLINGGFELLSNDTVPYWYVTSSSRINTSTAISGGSKEVSFSPAYNYQDGIYQYVNLSNGSYTLSFDYSTIDCGNVDVWVQVESASNTSEVYSKQLAVNLDYAAERIFDSISFDVNSSTGSGKYKISFYVKGTSSNCVGSLVLVDNFMLEKAIGPSSYNMVQCGNFEDFSYSSSFSPLYRANQFWTIYSNTSPSAISNGKLQLSSGMTSEATATQTIYNATMDYYNLYGYNCSPSGSYIVSGYATSEDAVSSPNACFALRVEVEYFKGTSDSEVENFHFDFIPSVAIKQFTTGSFTIDSTRLVKEIRIICDFSGQVGTASFDNISMIRSTDSSISDYEYYTQDDGSVIAGKIKTYRTPQSVTTYSYELAWGKITSSETIANDGSKTTCMFFYDESGLLEEESTMRFSADGSFIDDTVTIYEYNDFGQNTTTLSYLVTEDASGNDVESAKLCSTAEYETVASSHIFGALKSETDTSGNKTTYAYDDSTGWLKYVHDASNNGLYYSYDEMGRITSVRPLAYVNPTYAAINWAEKVTYTYNTKGQISQMSTKTTLYQYTYDEFGNTTSIKAGDNILAQYEYDDYNGKLLRMTYATGEVVRYVYDDLDRIAEMWYTVPGKSEQCRYRYVYTDRGSLSRVDDLLIGQETLYQYDSAGRLIGCAVADTNKGTVLAGFKYLYDTENRLVENEYCFDYTVGSSSMYNYLYSYYDYGEEQSLEQYELYRDISLIAQIDYVYDDLNRLSQKVNTYENFANTTQYTYRDISSDTVDDQTTVQVSQYKSTIGNTSIVRDNYTYDSRGNIAQITNKNGKIIKYTYDDQNQLIREDNQVLGKTYVYTYDYAGNRTSVKTYSYTTAASLSSLSNTEVTYAYSSSDWGDQLTAVGSVTMTYDALGNPTTYNGLNLEWEGRQLKKMKVGTSTNYAFEYNADGLRTKKTSKGMVHYYVWEGSKLVSERWGSHLLLYMYDESGSPIGLQYRLSSYAEDVFDVFYFVKNLQGDIVAIYNESGTLIGSYTYDAWGNCTATVQSGNTTLENNIVNTYNPFRYRGYYYDVETSMYYLQSRYYVPAWGRFLNADGSVNANGDLIGFNMYAYCSNNPVMYTDESGESLIGTMLIGAGICAGVDLLFQLIGNGGNFQAVDWKSVALSGAAGAVSSFMGFGLGKCGQVVAGFAQSQTGKIAYQFLFNVVGGAVIDVMTECTFGDLHLYDTDQVIETFMYSMLLSSTLENINNGIRKANKMGFDMLSRRQQKQILTNEVFKNGNHYISWTWSTYANTTRFSDYLDSGIDEVGYLWDILTEIVGSRK